MTCTLRMVQLPIGSVFKDPGYYAMSTAPGYSNPVTVTSKVVTGESATQLRHARG